MKINQLLNLTAKLLLPMALLAACMPVFAQQLVSGGLKLSVVPAGVQQTVQLSYQGKVVNDKFPVTLIVDSVDVQGNYDKVMQTGKALVCSATVRSANGSVFGVTDVYTLTDGAAGIDRKVKVIKSSPADHWFNSYIAIAAREKSKLNDFEFFAPGIWYKNNQYLPAKAIAANYDHHYFYIREDRLPLPLIMRREASSGQTITLIHEKADPQTTFTDTGLERLTDGRLQFGSLGIRQLNGVNSMVFMFPGSEGETTYVPGRKGKSEGNKYWALRSHPVEPDVVHSYILAIKFANAAGFPDAVKQAWETAYRSYAPVVHPVDMRTVQNEEVKLLDHYWKNINGAPGWPFSVYLPEGNARAYNYQLGFIGMQVPNAFYFLRDGLQKNDEAQIKKASLIIDFWAKNGMSETGLPKTWVDPWLEKAATWRHQPTFMRIVGDGMEGALNAWSAMKKHGINKPEWLAFCTRFGDWLVKNQNDDGSYCLSYRWWENGKVEEEDKHTTVDVIRYLLELHKATGNEAYLKTALKAGDFSYKSIHNDYLYVAGVIDNPKIKDRESGQQAIYAFLSLYDITGDQKWLNAAVQAANYAETFMYAYKVEVAKDDTLADFPRHKDVTGQTLIATGHSGIDNGFSFSSFQYYRLYLLTGDQHLLQVARMLMYNTLQTMDLDGKIGYRFKALQTEAFSIAGGSRGHGVRQWLAWNTAAVLDPLARFAEGFGEIDIDKIEQLPLKKRQQLNKAYGSTLGIYNRTGGTQ